MHNFNERVLTKNRFLIFIMTIALFLSACGGGGGNDNNNEEGEEEEVTVVAPQSSNVPTLSFKQTKQFVFTWDDVDDATFYRILEDKDGNSGFTQVSNDIQPVSETFSLEIPLYLRTNAFYILQSCNIAGCTSSSKISVGDNLVGSIGYLKASNTGSSDEFGRSISLSDDGKTLAIGALQEDSNSADDQTNDLVRNSGAVYIFNHESSGSWVQQTYLKASNIDPDDNFGGSVSLSSDGKTLAVGARFEDSSAKIINGDQSNDDDSNSGAVYLYSVSEEGNWSQVAYIKGSNNTASNNFGRSVDLNGNGTTLVVGAVNVSNLAIDNFGQVYVFVRESADSVTWTEQEIIFEDNAGPRTLFGDEVELSEEGNTLAIANRADSSNAQGIDGDETNHESSFNGAVFIYVRDNTEKWAKHAYIKASNSGRSDTFGSAISLSADGKVLAVGADNEGSSGSGIDADQTDNSLFSSGAAYIFIADTFGNWQQQAYLKSSNPDEDDQFGGSIALSADGLTLAVGAIFEASNAIGLNGDQEDNSGVFFNDIGAVYVFKNTAGVWAQQAYVKPSKFIAEEDKVFGTAVSLSADGSTLAVGAKDEASNATGVNGNQLDTSEFKSGAVYLY